MKRLLITLTAALTFASCTKNADTEVSSQSLFREFTATIEQAETRTSVNLDSQSGDYGKTQFENGDQVKVFNGKTSAVFTYDSSTGKFSTQETMETSQKYYAVFPASICTGDFNANGSVSVMLPQTQSFKENAVENAPLYSESSSSEFSFKNLCGILRMQTAGDGRSISSMVLRAARTNTAGAAQILAGGTVEMDVDPCLEISIDCGGQQVKSAETADHYFILPAQVYVGGFEIDVNFTDGTKSLQGTTSDICITASKIDAMKLFTASSEEFSGGNGTQADPYLIATAADLQALSELCANAATSEKYASSHYRQTRNIDMSSVANLATICSTEAVPFSGTYDGCGHRIYNLKVSMNNCQYTGLWGYLTGKVNNLCLGSKNGNSYDGVSIITCAYPSATAPSSGYAYCGMIAYAPNATDIKNVQSYCSMTTTGVPAVRMGGIIGGLKAATGVSCIQDCFYGGEMRCENANNASWSHIAGIISWWDGPGSKTAVPQDDSYDLIIRNCDSDASFTITATRNRSGGIAGNLGHGAILIEDCDFSGKMYAGNATTSQVRLSGITGYFYAGSVFKSSRCSYSGLLEVCSQANIGGFNGGSNTGSVNLIEDFTTTADATLKTSASFTSVGLIVASPVTTINVSSAKIAGKIIQNSTIETVLTSNNYTNFIQGGTAIPDISNVTFNGEQTEDDHKDALKILAIGNSFSRDAVEQHLWELFNTTGKEVIIGNMYIGGCDLQKHLSMANSNEAAYSYRKIVSGIKSTTADVTLEYGLKNEKWDIITFQQGAGWYGYIDTITPYLQPLIDYAKSKCTNADVKIGYHLTWAAESTCTNTKFSYYDYDQMKMYNMSVDVCKQLEKMYTFDYVINSIDAIQNGRTTFLGDTFCSDGWHLNTTYGRYTAACLWYEVISGQSVVGNTYHPVSISDNVAYACQRSAHEAATNKYQITDLSSIPDLDKSDSMLASWLFTPKAAEEYKATWTTADTPIGDPVYSNAPGEIGYINANREGSGKLSYVQIDKTPWQDTALIEHHILNVSNGGQPVITGQMKGDYWLMETTGGANLKKGEKISAGYTVQPGAYGAKYWLAEYLDGETWKPVSEIQHISVSNGGLTEEIDYNIAFTASTKYDFALTVTLENDTPEFKVRMTCGGTYQVNGKIFDHPNIKSVFRIAGTPEDNNLPYIKKLD